MGVVVTRETDYAFRILRELQDGKKHLTADVAEACLIPLPFTYKILTKLRKANLVEVTRGAKGGIQVACDYYTTSVADVLSAMEEDLVLNDCLRRGAVCEWREKQGKQTCCSVHEHLRAMQDRINQTLGEMSLADLLFIDGKPSSDKPASSDECEDSEAEKPCCTSA